MTIFSYMADFGYIAKALTMTADKARKVESVVNKKLSRLASTGKMVSSDSTKRNSALNSYNTLKNTGRKLAKYKNYSL